ncbi:MAG: hypothetical protein ACLSS9_06975 [Acutalibacteraceae bacterium]
MNKGIVVGGGHSLREYTVSVAKTERDTVIYVSEDLRRACRRRCRGGCGDGDRRRMALYRGFKKLTGKNG